MTRTRVKGLVLLLVLAGAALAGAAWVLAGRPAGAALVALPAAVWAGWLLWLYPRWLSAPGLLAGLLTLGGAAALLGERSGIGTWVYLAAVCTLAAWDLSAVIGRFSRVAVVVGEAALLGAHVRRLAVVSGLALLLGLLGPGLVPAGFNFHVALLLALLLALGLGRLLRSI